LCTSKPTVMKSAMGSVGTQVPPEWHGITRAMLERERELASQQSSGTNTRSTVTPNGLSNTVSPLFTPVSTGGNTPQLPSPGRPSLIGSQTFSNPGGITVVPESGKAKLLRDSDKPSASNSGGKSPRVFGWSTPRLSPLPSPLRRHLTNMKEYLQEIGHLTTIDPHDAWLPITESRSGNAYYAAFHNLNAIIGFQALLLPVAFTFLGWYRTCHIISISNHCYPLRRTACIFSCAIKVQASLAESLFRYKGLIVGLLS
jgi:hypothetical protein